MRKSRTESIAIMKRQEINVKMQTDEEKSLPPFRPRSGVQDTEDDGEGAREKDEGGHGIPHPVRALHLLLKKGKEGENTVLIGQREREKKSE